MDKEFLEQATALFMPTYNRFPVVFDHGKGSRLYDTDGKEYIDFAAGIAVNSLGYNDEGVKKTITDQINKVQHTSNLYWTQPVLDAAKAVVDASGLDLVFFTNSGSEAVETALKLARRYASLNKSEDAVDIVSMNGSFHGRTYGAVTATGQPHYHEHFGPMLPNVIYAEYNNLDSVRDVVGDTTAAVIVEPIIGEGGIIPADEEFLKGLREICDETGTVLIFDEVQCGAGRSGKFLACDHYGVKPDIVAMAKGIGAGFPVGAVVAVEKVGKALAPGTHGTTYGGNPLACSVVAHVVPRVSDSAFLEEVEEKGDYLKGELLKLKEKYPELINDVRGKGLILGVGIEGVPASEIVTEALANGLVVITAEGNTVRIVPPLVITKEEIDQGVKILDDALASVERKE